MTEEEIRQRVKEILIKRDLGNDLTSQEEKILAYTHYAAGEQAVRNEGRTGHRDRRVASHYLGKLPRTLRSSSKAVSSSPFLEIRVNLRRAGFALAEERVYISAIPHEHSLALGLWTT